MSQDVADRRTRFEALSYETVLDILIRLPDLGALDSLIRASPRAYRVFNTYAVKIIEAILSSDYTHRHTCVIIRIIILIRSSKLPIQSLAEFKKKVTEHAMLRRFAPLASGFPLGQMSKISDLVVLRSILATSRQMEFMALDCLKSYVDRFNNLKPQHLADDKFQYRTTNSLGKQYVSIWAGRPAGRYFKFRDERPPSWFEEQRMIRAFWRLELIQTLRKAALHSLLSWPKEDVIKLNSVDPVSFFYGKDIYRGYNTRDQPHHPEFEELNSVIDYTRELRQGKHSELLTNKGTWPNQRPQEVNRHLPPPPAPWRKKDWKKLIFPSWGYYFYSREISPHNFGLLREVGFPPMNVVPFAIFRHLGFAFWDRERLEASGLAQTAVQNHGEDSLPSSVHFYFYAWESLLTGEQKAEIDEKRKAEFSKK